MSRRDGGVVLLSLAGGALLWELGTRRLSPAVAAPFSATMSRLLETTVSGELPRTLIGSLVLFAVGLAIAIVVALPLGLLLARLPAVRIAFTDVISVGNAMPMVALIPFILSLVGLDFGAKVLVVFLFAFFPVLYNTVEGARSIKPELVEVARSFRSSEWAMWREVMIPAAFPYAMTGVRQAIGRALVGMVAAEFFLSASGIGQLLLTSARNFDTAGLFATVLVITVLGVGLMAIGRALEDRFTLWRGTRN